MPKAAFFQAVPFLLVDDVRASGEYWHTVLGFNALRFVGGDLAILVRNATRVTLRKTSPGARPISLSNQSKLPSAIDLYISVSDIEAYAAELRDRGADVIQPLALPSREITVRDLNGYAICFGEEQNWPY